MGFLTASISVSPTSLLVGGTTNVTCTVTNSGSLPIAILGQVGTVAPHSQTNTENQAAVSGAAPVGSGIPQNVPANGTLTLYWTVVLYGPVVQDALGHTSWTYDIGAILNGGDGENITASTATATVALMDQYLAIVTPNNTSQAKSTTATFTVALTHGDGTTWANVPVSFAVGSGGGSVTGTPVQTNAAGQASATVTLGSSVTTNTFTATVTGATGSPVTFTVKGT